MGGKPGWGRLRDIEQLDPPQGLGKLGLQELGLATPELRSAHPGPARPLGSHGFSLAQGLQPPPGQKGGEEAMPGT